MLLKGEVMSNMESYIKILRQQCDIVSQPPMHVRYDPIYPQLKKINMLSSFFYPGKLLKKNSKRIVFFYYLRYSCALSGRQEYD